MADPNHLEELEKGVSSWNHWRANDNRGRPNLSGANLSGANLSGANLSGANLSGANLSEANLFESHLLFANLSGANLVGACLNRADLSEANLSGANLSEADLRYAILRGARLNDAFLTWANLNSASLPGANLRWTNLARSNLSCADLSGADLSGAILGLANLSEANLSEASLNEANLSGTNLGGANLTLSDLSGAFCGGTIWADVMLHNVKGLATLHHTRESSVSTGTLVLSLGRIPTEFLKGCGLSDWEIENAKLYDPDLPAEKINDIQYCIHELLVRGPIQISPVFISYSHGDTAFVDRLGAQLDKEGVRYWRDTKDATAGRLDKVIERGISLNPTLLLVLSKCSIESEWVEYEIDKAVNLSKRLKRDVLCPIAIDKSWTDSSRMSGRLKTQIEKYVVLDFSVHEDETVFFGQFRKLIDGLGLHYRDQNYARGI